MHVQLYIIVIYYITVQVIHGAYVLRPQYVWLCGYPSKSTCRNFKKLQFSKTTWRPILSVKSKFTRFKMGRSTNLFKFVSFTERISKLRINVVHKIEKRSEIPEDLDTFFQQSLAKWTELNCSLDFQAFHKEINGLVKSLSLLVYHQKAVVEILKRYLAKKDSLALDALLELCVELSRDLQGDFSQYFTEFLRIIAGHLDTKDAQKIEDCFKTLAYLFKFQWRYLVKDLKSIFRYVI